jgi:Flp pilus assembly protein TadG
MALEKTLTLGRSLKQRGQGAVEAMVALPVFLILVCVIFQVFFLGIAKFQLHYAAFCAARIGAVNNADKTIMEHAIKKILTNSPGLSSFPEANIEIEILNPEINTKDTISLNSPSAKETLKVQVQWNYPLIVPLADKLLHQNSLLLVPGKPSILLKASWAMPMIRPLVEVEGDAIQPQK